VATQKDVRTKQAVIQIRVLPEVKSDVEHLAKAHGITVTALVTRLIRREIVAEKRAA
jgi:antitoxin component of RelBE/YafQ-DinJ toxin-antitoxin module